MMNDELKSSSNLIFITHHSAFIIALSHASVNIGREIAALLIYPDSEEARERASKVVAAGGLVAFRTDTFYGLGADPSNREALEAINELKGRDGKPILVLVSDPEVVERLIAHRTRAFDALAANNWPGALTLVVAAREDVPELLTAGTGTVGVRLPEDESAGPVVRACGGVPPATHGNAARQPPRTT